MFDGRRKFEICVATSHKCFGMEINMTFSIIVVSYNAGENYKKP